MKLSSSLAVVPSVSAF